MDQTLPRADGPETPTAIGTAAATGARPFSLAPLMFETFTCTMAIMAFVALVGPVAHTLSLQPWHIGVTVTAGGLTWIAAARWWGGLSDRRGRRPVILAGLSGFALCYFLLCLFIDYALGTALPAWLAFAGLVLGRGLVGLFYAAVPATAAALVADHVEPARRAGAMAAIGAASGAGMVLGPGFVGLLAPMGLSVPLYITAVMPVLALFALWWILPRQEQRAPATTAPPRLADPRLRQSALLAFVAAFSVTIAQVTVGFYALDRLGLSAGAAAQAAGIALTVVGVALVISQSVLRWLNWPPLRLIRAGASVAALGFVCAAFSSDSWSLWLCYGIAAAGMGWVYPSVSALAANAVDAHEQGVAAGTVSAMQGLGAVAGPLAGTLIYSVSVGAPYLMIGILLLAAGWVTRSTP
ncbi:MFS transporter [Parahaliea mediterranea]|uniref:MFS transporter n=1 Tax=Parahaliea mediterranea TaxID=651086 RepID=UPI000E2F5668|nr:MFS transporter [Parahaliea mediterranea]